MSIGIARDPDKAELARQIAEDTKNFLKAGGKIQICTSADNASIRFEREKYSRKDFSEARSRSHFNDDRKMVH